MTTGAEPPSAERHGTLADLAREGNSAPGDIHDMLRVLFARLGVERGAYVEFGAWDGRLSNTRDLAGWRGLLIEADPRHFAALQRNVARPGVRLLNATVATTGDGRLDAILAREDFPQTFELLSIDIDSDDLAVWAAMQRFRARCVVIEHNPTIPLDTHFVNPPGKCWGNSARAIAAFAARKNYRLVAAAGMNLVFLDAADAAAAGIDAIPLGPELVPKALRYFWGYDGTLVAANVAGLGSGPELLGVPWHRYVFAQPMPRWLRRWRLGRQWRRTEAVVGSLAAALTRPLAFLRYGLERRRSTRKDGER